MSPGHLFVISAPSGTGKTTILRRLAALLPDLIHSVSCTTRSPRAGEVDGRDYHFLQAATFQEMLARDDFVEWARVHGAHYGTPRAPLEGWLATGKDVICDLDIQGWRSLRAQYAEATSIFVMPPSRDVLVARLRGRGTEDAEALQRRLAVAEAEMAAKGEYHHVLINDAIEAVCAAIRTIMLAQRGPRRSS